MFFQVNVKKGQFSYRFYLKARSTAECLKLVRLLFKDADSREIIQR
jgi:hypothetical protein